MTIHDYDDCADYAAPDRFIVTAHRSGGSICGAATAPCKDRDGIKIYRSRKAAEADAKRWNAALTSRNVRYTVERY